MSIITYNNVQLPYGYIENFDQDIVYDGSDTDRYLQRFDITTECLISSTYAAQLSPALGRLTSNPADFMAWLRQQLEVPRKKLSVIVNGVELIPQPQAGKTGTVDAKSGPLPQKLKIIALNDTTFIVQFRVLAHYWENSGTSIPVPPITNTNLVGNTVLSNRWREQIIIDNRNFTRRIRTGRFIIRSDNAFGFIPDQLRTQMAVVAIPTGFVRERNEYTVEESGLAMSYVQEDREVFKLPPTPAFVATGSTRYITTYKEPFIRVICSVHLEGDGSTATLPIVSPGGVPLGVLPASRNLNQLTLIHDAIIIACQKCRSPLSGTIPADVFPEKVEMNVELWDNVIDFSLTVRRMKTDQRLFSDPGIPLESFYTTGITETPISDGITLTGGINRPTPNPPPRYLPRGTASLLLEAAAYYDPNLSNAQVTTQAGSPPLTDSIFVTPNQPSVAPSQLTNGGTVLPMPGQTG